MIESIRQRLSIKALSDRMTLYIAILTIVSAVPILVFRIFEQNWPFVVIDAFIITCIFLIAFAVYKNYKTRVMQFVLGLLVSAGLIAICMLGTSEQLYWMFPGIIAIFFLFQPNIAIIFCCGIYVLSLNILMQMPSSLVLSYVTATFPTMFFIYFCAKALRNHHANLNTLATEDFLTETGNRRAFQQDSELSIANLNRHKTHSVLVLLDMDHFKLLNDKFGHNIGDRVLQSITELIKKRLRRTDKLYRIGGEEFSVILSPSEIKDALTFAEDLKTFIKENRARSLPSYTISFGLAQLLENDSVEDWLQRADTALYNSKENGRDQISVAH